MHKLTRATAAGTISVEHQSLLRRSCVLLLDAVTTVKFEHLEGGYLCAEPKSCSISLRLAIMARQHP